MPARISSFGTNRSSEKRAAFVNNSSAEAKMKDSELVDKFYIGQNEIDVLEKRMTEEWVRYFFLSGKEKIAYYAGFVNDGRILTQIIEAKKGFLPGKSLMAEIYKNFILKRYNTVISDSGLTASGLHFWKNNFQNFKNAGYSVGACKIDSINNLNMQDMILFSDVSQFDKYYGHKEWHYFIRR